MADFKAGKILVLCNCDLISEGFNVPDCSCVVLLRPTESLVLYIQQSMRSMRFVPGKHAVIIDQVGNFKKFGTPAAPHTWTLEDRKKKKATAVVSLDRQSERAKSVSQSFPHNRGFVQSAELRLRLPRLSLTSTETPN